MYRAYLGPSSGGTTVCIQKLVLIVLFRWLYVVLVGLESIQDNIQSSKKNNKYQLLYTYGCIARSTRDGTRAETRFGLSAKRTSPFKSAGVSVQSTAGSRGVRIRGQQLYRTCSDVQCKTTGYPLHSHLSPSLPLPCVNMCHQVLNALYLLMMGLCTPET